MLEKALRFWGRGQDPSPQAAEWLKLSKDKIEPILAKWKTLTPEQVLQEVNNRVLRLSTASSEAGHNLIAE